MVATTRRPEPPRPSSLRRAKAAVAVFGAVLGTSGIVGLAGPAQAATTKSVTFDTPGTNTWRVPSAVTSIQVKVSGAAGGASETGAETGGRGDTVQATIPVQGGQVLAVTVGSQGGSGNAAGVPGGGTGGAPQGRRDAGAGGGYSAIFMAATPTVVAGGGGGAGQGIDGGDAGQDGGSFMVDRFPTNGRAGLAGTLSSGGAGGTGGVSDPTCTSPAPGGSGAAGTSLQGGNGGISSSSDNSGGGGGGGYFGGGGGGGGAYCLTGGGFGYPGGGGGGSSFVSPQATDVSEVADTTGSGSVQISYTADDDNAPVAAPSTDQPQNSAGWIKHSPVKVNWGWSDPGGQIDSSTCTTQSSASAEGSTTVSASCADGWGNIGTASYTVNLDTGKPVDAPTQTQTDSGTTVDWNWSDATSGVDVSHCQEQSSTSAVTGSVTASCTDVAGNTATDTYTIKDTTAPKATPVVTPAPNAAGWNNSDVSVAWNWSDSGSGVDPANCVQSSHLEGELVLPLSGGCTDLAGNYASATVHLKVDETKPVDNPVVTTTATGASVAWNWSDALSGVDPSSCTQSSSQTGTGQLTFTSSCTDLAGNTATDSKTVTVSAPATKADLQLTLSGPTSVARNSSVTYTVKVRNSGPGTASNVVSTLLLPSNAVVVSATGSPVRTTSPLNLETWTAPSIASGATVTYTVTVKFPTGNTKPGWVLAAATGSLPTKTAPATPDPNWLNNGAVVTTKVS